MKKLIMAVAIVCVAAFAHAASVGWTCAGLTNYKGNAYDFFVVGQSGVTSVDQITQMIVAGSDVSTYAFGSGNVADNGAANTMAAASGKKLDGGSTYVSFYVIFDSASVADATSFLAITTDQSSTLTQSPAATASTFSFIGGNQATYANAASNWTAVPEPTSGLLLLLGMAGLALKRKVA